MSIIANAANAFYTYRFLRILTQKWEDMDAYKLGIIDAEGNILKKTRQLKTREEKSAYSIFHRLVFNLKKILEKLPLGKTRIASYAAAMFLIREHTDITEDQIAMIFEKLDHPIDRDEPLFEHPLLGENNSLKTGKYQLVNDILSFDTGEIVAFAGTKVTIDENTALPIGRIFGHHIFEVLHEDTKEYIFISSHNIKQ